MAELRAETGWRSRQVSHSEPVGLALLLTEKGKTLEKIGNQLREMHEKL